MKHYVSFFAVLLFVALLPALAAAAGFSRVIEDLPLMPGMTEIAEGAVVFDKPTGRVIETTLHAPNAATPDGQARVLQFYRAALPQLGWTRQDDRRYTREHETMTISFNGDTVHVTITPTS